MASESKSALRPFGMKDKLGYMFGDFGNDFTFILSSLFLMKFYTDVMGVSAGVVGIVMMAARIVDAFYRYHHGSDRGPLQAHQGRQVPPVAQADVRPCGHCLLPDLPVRSGRDALRLQGGLAGSHLHPVGLHLLHLHQHPLRLHASAVSPESKDRAELSTWRTIGASLATLSSAWAPR